MSTTGQGPDPPDDRDADLSGRVNLDHSDRHGNKHSGLRPAPAHWLWKKGQPSPNPAGRPKGLTLKSLIKEFGQRRTNLKGEPLPNGATFNEMVVEAIAYAAINGNMQAALIWLEWTDGKLTHHSAVELSRASDADLKAMTQQAIGAWLADAKEVSATTTPTKALSPPTPDPERK